MNKKAQWDLGLGLSKPKRKRKLTPADKKRIASKQNWKCKKCRKTLPARYHIDHIREFAKGGSDLDENLQALCPNCHADKTENDRAKKRAKKIREQEKKEKKEKDIFGFSLPKSKPINLFGSKKGRKPKMPKLF